MFEQFYGFTSQPFSKEISPDDMFHSPVFSELQKRFDYMKNKRGIMLVSGPAGSGKTSAIRHFLNSLDAQSFMPVYIPLATVPVSDFYRQLNAGLNGSKTHSKSLLFKSIQNQILDYSLHKAIIPVIVFDEAHLLKDQNFLELQIISNFQCDTIDPALFILVGQNVLFDKLNKYFLRSFYQRISLKYRLEPLSKSQIQDYILHQFKISGCKAEIFNEPAFEAVYKLSNGNVRIAGELVRNSLILAAEQKKTKITEEEVMTASSEVL